MWSSTSCLKFQSFFWSKYYLVSWYTSYWINFIIYLYTYNCSFWILHWVLIYISKLIQANKKRKASHNYTDLNPFLSNSYIYCTYTNLSSDLNSQWSLEIQLTSFCLSSNSTDNKESTTESITVTKLQPVLPVLHTIAYLHPRLLLVITFVVKIIFFLWNFFPVGDFFPKSIYKPRNKLTLI